MRIYFFRLKGGRVKFWVKMLIPRTHFLKILTPFLGSIYIAKLIFTRNIIISVTIEFSLRLTGQSPHRPCFQMGMLPSSELKLVNIQYSYEIRWWICKSIHLLKQTTRYDSKINSFRDLSNSHIYIQLKCKFDNIISKVWPHWFKYNINQIHPYSYCIWIQLFLIIGWLTIECKCVWNSFQKRIPPALLKIQALP